MPPHAVITISDSRMNVAISRTLNKSPGESITAGGLATIQTLAANRPRWVRHCVYDAEVATEHCESESRTTIPTDLSVLPLLTNLTDLALSNNAISDISPREELTTLRSLNLSTNYINDISPLVDLTNLTVLHLEGNEISDISPLVENSGLGEGDRIWLGNNDLNFIRGSEALENIKRLEARGVRVFHR